MKKMKKLLLAVLTLGCTLSFAFACGAKGGDVGNSSEQSQSSSVTSSEVISSEDESSDSSESFESSESSEGSESSESSENSESVHTCSPQGDWITNTKGHWLKCECGKIVSASYGSHAGTAKNCGEQAVCDTCGAPYGDPKDHEYGDISDGEHGMAYYCTCGDYILNKDLVDFIVPIESGKDPVVLQLSDTQTCNWGDLDKMCNNYVKETVKATKPDLIILTGDIVYGRFDPNGALLKNLIACMDELKIPWAPVFGNHDNESLMGVDWQCQQLEAAKYCLFKQGDVTGNGNYTVGLEQDGKLLRVFYMMDSNGCSTPMCDSNGAQTVPAIGTNVVKTSAGFGSDQVTWFIDSAEYIHQLDESVKFSMAHHIQSSIFNTAFKKYEEYDGLTSNGSILSSPLNLDTLEGADETDFGYLGRTMKGPWMNGSLSIANLKSYGVDSIFVGHEHCNSVSIVYDGIRFQYGQKSSTYDRYNSVSADGTIFGGYIADHPAGSKELIGGTVIPISSEDGSIGTGYIYYCGDPFNTEGESGTTGDSSSENGGSSETPTQPAIVVDGLQYGTDITAQSDKGSSYGSMKAVAYDENTNAYYIVSGESYNRIYINVDLLKGKTTVSFDILVPEEATNADGSAAQEFAIRVKPNPTKEQLPGVDGGYLWFDASYTNERKVTIGEWQTIVIDISAFADACTEFGIYFLAGNNSAYVKNITVS